MYVTKKEHINIAGSHSVDVPNCSMDLAELEPFPALLLTQVDLHTNLCDKELLCTNASLIPLPQHVKILLFFIHPLVLKLNIWFSLQVKMMSSNYFLL